MPKLLELLDQLEDAIPEMRTALEGNGDYMAGDDEEGALPPLPDEEGAEDPFAEGEEPVDLESPPPLPKKKKSPLPF